MDGRSQTANRRKSAAETESPEIATGRGRRTARVPSHAPAIAAAVLAVVLRAALSVAGEPDPPAWPGKPFPRPEQRGMDEIEAIPSHGDACPVCGFSIAVPEPEKLMRRRDGGDGPPTEWEMHAGERDADLCPHPGKGKLAYQADILVCPSCGLSAKTDDFFAMANPEFRGWTLSHLRPSLQAAQRRLLGARGAETPAGEAAAFFNRQEEIPDRLRLEHARSVYAVLRAPPLVQAEMNWLAAWAVRRELVLPPSGAELAAPVKNARAAMEKLLAASGGARERVLALERLQGKTDSGKDRLAAAERCVARLLLAGLRDRLGDADGAEAELSRAYAFSRERYARVEQDPLWSATPRSAARRDRERRLEKLRRELEIEASARIALLSAERDYLRRAAGLLKSALLAGAFDNKPEEALFYAYLIGEFHRHAGELPLSAVWLNAVAGLSAGKSPLHASAVRQFAAVSAQAGDRVNLVSGIGQDGESFEKLRAICQTR